MELWKSSKIQSRLYHIWLTLTPPGGGGRYSAQEQVDALLGTEVARCCLQVSTPNFERPYIICHRVSKDYEVFVRLIFSPFFYQVGIFFLTAQWWEEAKYIPEQKASKVGRNEMKSIWQIKATLHLAVLISFSRPPWWPTLASRRTQALKLCTSFVKIQITPSFHYWNRPKLKN